MHYGCTLSPLLRKKNGSNKAFKPSGECDMYNATHRGIIISQPVLEDKCMEHCEMLDLMI